MSILSVDDLHRQSPHFYHNPGSVKSNVQKKTKVIKIEILVIGCKLLESDIRVQDTISENT